MRSSQPSSFSAATLDQARQCHKQGQASEAERIYRQLLQHDPQNAEALHFLSVLLHQLNRPSEANELVQNAVSTLRQKIQESPLDSTLHYRLGRIYQSRRMPPPAAECFQTAAAIDPNYFEAFAALGTVLGELSRRNDAIIALECAATLNPQDARTQNHLGVLLAQVGRLEDAENCFRRSIALRPEQAGTYNNLANVLRALERRDEAIELFNRAIELQPDEPEFLNNLALAYGAQGRAVAAAATYRRAAALQPQNPSFQRNLANSLLEQGLQREAVAAYRKAISLKPDDPQTNSSMLLARMYLPDQTPESLFQAHEAWGRRHAGAAAAPASHANSREPGRVLRIGYVSPDLREHPVGLFMQPLLPAHDRRTFHVACFSDSLRSDEITARLKSCADTWHETAGLTDEQFADRVREEKIDLLIDLSGHSAANRLLAFARKPAPVQLTWLGYPQTTGLRGAIDYRITDPWADPPGDSDRLHTEKLLRLPDCFAVFQAPDPSPPVARSPVLTSGTITFGCLNNLAKLNDEVVALWSRLLREVRGSRLLLSGGGEPKGEKQLRARFARHGIDPGRLLLHLRLPFFQYLELYNQIDIALDPFPFNGHTTSVQALWMGVPLLTLSGDRHAGRMGVSLLKSLGLEHELVATSPDDYVHKVKDLASDLPRLQALREGMRSRMQRSPLMDAPRFARNLEAAYRRAWEQWCREAAPGTVRSASTTTEPTSEVSYSLSSSSTAPGATVSSRAANPVSAATPPEAEQQNEQGIRYATTGDPKSAEACFRRAVSLAPGNAGFHCNLANSLTSLGSFRDALAHYERAVTLDPSEPRFHASLAGSLQTQGEHAGAIASYERALALDAINPSFHNGLGISLQGIEQDERAIAAFEQALCIDPTFAAALNNLTNSYRALHRLEDAAATVRRVIALSPGDPDAHLNLAGILHDQGLPDEAAKVYRKTLSIAPNFLEAHSNYLFSLEYDPGIAPAQLLAEHRKFNDRHAAPLARFIRPHTNDRNPDRPLRVGYLSADFRAHPVGLFIEPVLATHDPSAVHTVCYAAVEKPDAVTERFGRYAKQWRNVIGLAPDRIAQQARDDKIDILVDLAGHSGASRILVFAFKPAPVQVTYLGYPDTTGLSSIDYRITDALADPPGMTDAFHSEKLVRLPDCFACYQAPEGGPDVGPVPALGAGHVTFGSLNNFAKVNPQVIALWSRVLASVPNARLMLVGGEPAAERRVRDAFARHDIDPSRVLVTPRKSFHEFLATFNEIDVALDPFPFNGHTTTLHTLWMGVPVITLAGPRHASRMGVSVLTNLALPELIARSPDDYLRIATTLAVDLPRLGILRSTLRAQLLSSPLMDRQRFTKNLEAAYRTMWRTYVNS